MKLDFVILSLPRSGTHMLASALDSHPDIECAGEIWRKTATYPQLGQGDKQVKGAILMWGVKHYMDLTDVKIICLLRNAHDRLKSHKVTGWQHFTAPIAAELVSDVAIAEEKLIGAEHRANELREYAESKGALILDYDEITQGRDVRELPTEIEVLLCEFLAVTQHRLTPTFYKPV